MNEELKRFCLYTDLKELYKDTLPEIDKFRDKLADYRYENSQRAQMIQGFDVNLALKASKVELNEINSQKIDKF